MAIKNTEAKQLLYDETPVYFNGSKYKKISALIYRKSEGRYKASAELLDMNENSVVICPIQWVDASKEERIEIFGQEEAEVLLAKCQEEMTRLIEFVSQSKIGDSQDSLYRLLSKLIKLDNQLIKQVQAREKYGDDPKKGMEIITNELEKSFSFGGLSDEEGRETIIPQEESKEEARWTN